MEPCCGGRLASLNEKADAMLKKGRPDDSIASWAFRFLQSLPNVQVVLSGMTTMEQVVENVKLFSEPDPTTEEEHELLQQAIATMVNLVPCTACRSKHQILAGRWHWACSACRGKQADAVFCRWPPLPSYISISIL
jgi:predicted aldo/keto reductase-like oxidoreductase